MKARASQIAQSEKIQWAILALILLLAGALYIWKFNHFQFGTYQDDASYLNLARSIAEGGPYGLINQPDEVLPTRYPFGYPLLVAAAGATGLADIVTLAKSQAFLFTALNVILIAVGWRLLFFSSRWIGLAVAALYALSPLVVAQTGMVMSEPANLFFILIGALLIGFKKRGGATAMGWAVLLGLVLVFAAYTRTTGFALVIGASIDLVRSRAWRWSLVMFASAVACLFLITTLFSVPINPISNSSEYLDQLESPEAWGQGHVADDYLQRVIQSIGVYTRTIVRDSLIPFIDGPSVASILEPVGLGFVPLILSLLICGAIVLGLVQNGRVEGLQAVHFYVVIYFATVILWPFRGVRFLYGILPFLYAYLLIGAQLILERLTVRRQRLNGLLVSSVLLTIFVIVLAGLNTSRSALIDNALNHVRDLSVGAEWLRENIAEDAVIIAEEPQAVHYYARRPTIDLPVNIATIREISSDRDNELYALVAPQLKWDSDPLHFSNRTNRLRAAILEGELEASMVYESRDNQVEIYRILTGP